MDILRAHYSWTQISQMAGKPNRGWAANAYQNQGYVDQRDVDTIRGLVEKILPTEPDEATEEPVAMQVEETPTKEVEVSKVVERGPQLSDEERQYVLDTLTIMESAGLTPYEIKETLGYGSGTSSSIIHVIRRREGAVSKRTYEMARKWRESHKPAPSSNGSAPKTTPMVTARKEEDPFAWMDKVAEKLLEAAVLIEQASETVPEAFRAPYVERRKQVETLMAEFQR